ncbi:class IV adenylate cyclase [Streptomyces boncukensis]|uniref:Class IV adenylate cyclase n=1 Tax=Streptomyces boncukensis TaxID=2711219 RepID=A0A6G4WV71_9ACTN|nr:class IV adenylate cyclase [Streptomyces boncukensis]NGO69176.1 class IV adenylate cyclase [Streptomyces boncukensis]
MIEAELKARVRNPEDVMRALEAHGTGRAEVYQDTYYDDPDGGLDARDAELRVRTIHGTDETSSLLTFKDAKVDEASGSKPEHETRVEDATAVHSMLRSLGYVPVIAFEKRCRNYGLHAKGRDMLATLVRVPEVDGTFLELETLVENEAGVSAALDDVRAVLADLGIDDGDLTRELYTDAVRARRGA